MRTETDSLGSLEVPDDALYGVHTVRSLSNFQISGERMPLEIIYAMVKLKRACALANARLSLLTREKCDAIVAACDEVLRGKHDDQFPLDVFQAGSGTSSNMNVNEVLANLANQRLGGRAGDRGLVHPNDDVNKGQSTNNIFPSGIKLACLELAQQLGDALQILHKALAAKGVEFDAVIKSGRTHLQDAVPVTLGQEFRAWARAVEKAAVRIETARAKLYELGAGGNAVGTGVNTSREFRPYIMRELQTLTGEFFQVAADGLEATQFMTDLAELSAALRLYSLDLQKICNDVRLLASGPRTGFFEIILPAVEPGSSIMPGKVNPSICEAVNMVCCQVQGYDAAVSAACGLGQLELNTHMPVMGLNLIKALALLSRATRTLAEKCIVGIRANTDACRRHFEVSAGLPTILNPRLGYDQVALLVKESLASGKSLRALILEKNIMPAVELDRLLASSTGPNA